VSSLKTYDSVRLKSAECHDKAVILPFVLYGLDMRFPALKGEHKLQVFENNILRIIFGLKKDDVSKL